MPRFVPDSRPISAQHPIAEFYREEFLKHHRCLQQQRAYYSESAITVRSSRALMSGMSNGRMCSYAERGIIPRIHNQSAFLGVENH